MAWRLDIYLLREWLKTYLLAFSVILGLLLVGDIQNYLQDLLDWEVPAPEIVRYFAIVMPGYLPMVIPVSLMISLLMVMGLMHRNHEVTALRAAGTGYLRITRMLWLIGIGMSGFQFFLNASVVPWSMENSRILWANYRFAHAEESGEDAASVGLLGNLTFFNYAENRMWYFNQFDESTFRGYGLTISQLNEEGLEEARIVANEAWFEDTAKQWVFVQGRRMVFDAGGRDPIQNRPFDELRIEDFSVHPFLMQALEKRPKDLSLNELVAVLGMSGSNENPKHAKYEVSYFDRLFNPLTCLVVVGFAVPFALQGVRANPLVGVSKALGWFVVYFLLLQIGQLLGGRWINPVFGAALPTALAMLYAFFLILRLRQPQ